MAKDTRPIITLACSNCRERTYATTKNRKNDPDRLDITRADNRHLAFGWASHFCFGAALARIEGQLTFEVIARRTANLALAPNQSIVWRDNLGLRGLTALQITFDEVAPTSGLVPQIQNRESGCPFHRSA